jgi:hypothetical protein
MTKSEQEAANCKRFEEWISSPPYERGVERYPESHYFAWPGQYKGIAVQLAWEAWQEAQKT